MKINNLFKSFFFVLLIGVCVFGYGEGDSDGYPNYYARSSLMVSNIARNNPHYFSNTFMAAFSNFSNSALSNVFQYNGYFVPSKPYELGNVTKSVSEAYLKLLLESKSKCGSVNVLTCNGLTYADFVKPFFSGSPSLINGFITSGNNPGYSQILEMICDRQPNGDCGVDNTTIVTTRYSFVHKNFSEIGFSSADDGDNTYFVYFYASPYSYSFYAIKSASHIWNYASSNSVSFFLTYYQPGDYPLKTILTIGGQNYTMYQFTTPDSSSITNDESPYQTNTYNLYSSASECDTYYFTVTTYGGRVYRYPTTGYLTLASQTSECDAWTTVQQGVSSSSTLVASLLFSSLILLFTILL